MNCEVGFSFLSTSQFSIQSSFQRNRPVQKTHSTLLSWGKCYVQNPPFPISLLSLSLFYSFIFQLRISFIRVWGVNSGEPMCTLTHISVSLCVQLHLCKCGVHTCLGMQVEIKGQLTGVSSARLPSRVEVWNTGLLAWWQHLRHWAISPALKTFTCCSPTWRPLSYFGVITTDYRLSRKIHKANCP